jgi:hypothetical protein
MNVYAETATGRFLGAEMLAHPVANIWPICLRGRCRTG